MFQYYLSLFFCLSFVWQSQCHPCEQMLSSSYRGNRSFISLCKKSTRAESEEFLKVTIGDKIPIYLCLPGMVANFQGIEPSDYLFRRNFYSESFVGRALLESVHNHLKLTNPSVPVDFDRGKIEFLKSKNYTCYSGVTRIPERGNHRYYK